MKRYLSGIDWVINSIDRLGKIRSGIGNVSQVVLALDGQPESSALRKSLQDFLGTFPVLYGLPRRDSNLCPYWKVFPGHAQPPLRLEVAQCADAAGAAALLQAQINKPFAGAREHLAFILINAGQSSFLGMTFDHRVLDGRGAEALLDRFERFYRHDTILDVALEEPPHLDHWREKFLAGRQVNRVFLGLAGKAPRTLPGFPGSRVCNVRTINFDIAQTACFTEAAYARAGYLMLMPYALAKNVQLMHRIFQARHSAGSSYLIPVSIDTRPQEAPLGEVFFNHVSFLLFSLEAAWVEDFPVLLARIKEQMYDQVKSGLPEAVKKASFLLRIVPLRFVNFFMQRMLKKEFASFSFSFVSSAYNVPAFMGAKVSNVFHLPRVPDPPGIGIFFTQRNDRINVTISYFEGILREHEVEAVVSGINAWGNENQKDLL